MTTFPRDRIVLAHSGGLDTSVAIAGPPRSSATSPATSAASSSAAPGSSTAGCGSAGDTFDQSLAEGLVELWGLPSRIVVRRDQRLTP